MKDLTMLSVISIDMTAGNGHINIAELIKSKCTDSGTFKRMIDSFNELRNTPLHWAVLNSQTQFVKYLLENGADTSIKNSDAQTPLDLAVNNENTEIAVRLKGNSRQKHEIRPGRAELRR